MRSRIFSPRENGFTSVSNRVQNFLATTPSVPRESIVNSSAPRFLHHSTRRQVSAAVKSLGARYRLTGTKLQNSDPHDLADSRRRTTPLPRRGMRPLLSPSPAPREAYRLRVLRERRGRRSPLQKR